MLACHRFVPALECLEGRLTPAGIINSSYSSLTKTLTLKAVDDLDVGDALLNSQNLTILGTGTPGEFKVETNGGDTINGVAADEAVISNVKNIKLIMGLGGDAVDIRNANLSGQLTFLGGEGGNNLEINASNGPNTLGRVLVRNGDGFDILRLVTGSNTVTGGLTVNNGSGGSIAFFGAFTSDQTSIGGPVKFTNGAGTDNLSFGGQNVTLSKAVTIQHGSGDSVTEFLASDANTIGGTLTVRNGDGFDSLRFGGGGASIVSAGSLNVNNGGGGSNTVFSGADHTFAGNVLIRNGDGDDTLNGNGVAAVTVTGTLALQNGNGSSTVTLTSVNLTVGGLTTLSSAAGNDSITLAGTASLQSLKILTGSGVGAVLFDSLGDWTIAGNLTFTGGGHLDSLIKAPSAPLNVTGNVTIALGNSSASTPQVIDFDSSSPATGVTVGGKLTVRGGDQVDNIRLFNVQVTGATLLDLGDGNDVMLIDFVRFGAATFQLGGGDDSVELESTNNGSATTFAGAFTFLGGSGNDLLSVGIDSVDDFVTFSKAPVRLDGGVGLDSLHRQTVDNVFPANQPIELSWETIV